MGADMMFENRESNPHPIEQLGQILSHETYLESLKIIIELQGKILVLAEQLSVDNLVSLEPAESSRRITEIKEKKELQQNNIENLISAVDRNKNTVCSGIDGVKVGGVSIDKV